MRSLYKHWVLDGRIHVQTGDATQRRLRTVSEVAARLLRSECVMADLLAAIGAAQLCGTPQRLTFLPPRLRKQMEQLASFAALVVKPAQLALPSFQALCPAALGADIRTETGLLVAIKPVCINGDHVPSSAVASWHDLCPMCCADDG
jgi:hypothetical protein